MWLIINMRKDEKANYGEHIQSKERKKKHK